MAGIFLYVRSVKKKKVQSPHDKFFKLMFRNPARALELLRIALPMLITEPQEQTRDRNTTRVVLLTDLRLTSESFVSEELQDLYSDVLFEATVQDTGPQKNRSGRPLPSPSKVLVYILFEHKSEAEHFTLLQLYRYMGEIWGRYVEQMRDREKGQAKRKVAELLPRVIPIIVYHGKDAWTAPLHFSEYFGKPAQLAGTGPELNPLLVDLHRIDESFVERLSLPTRVAFAAFKSTSTGKKADIKAAVRLAETMNPEERNSFIGAMTYLIEASPPHAKHVILETVTEPHWRAAVKTVGDLLRKEGRDQGRVEGKIEGKVEGVLEDRREVLTRLLTKKFDLSEADRQLIAATDDADRLGAALDEIIDAESKDQVLAKLRG